MVHSFECKTHNKAINFARKKRAPDAAKLRRLFWSLYEYMKALADIYFYNAMGLATELRNGTVSEARAVKHLIASIILGGVGFEVPVSIEFQETGVSKEPAKLRYNRLT